MHLRVEDYHSPSIDEIDSTVKFIEIEWSTDTTTKTRVISVRKLPYLSSLPPPNGDRAKGKGIIESKEKRKCRYRKEER